MAHPQNSEESWPSHAKLRGSATGHWFNRSRTSGRSGSKTSDTSEKHTDLCNVGAGDWLVHHFEPNTDRGFVFYQTHRVNFVHQPAKVAQMISMMEHGRIRMTECSRQVHQIEHNRSPKCQTHLGEIVGWEHSLNWMDQTDYRNSW